MKTIKNPNEIIEGLVSDFNFVLGDNVVSIAMYGSAVTHEYKPGISDINIVLILKDDSIQSISKCSTVAAKWNKSRVSIPFFMTGKFIASALDSYPVEFLDIKSNYRIIYGEDLFEHIDIKREHLRLQCERELRGISLHLRRSFIEYGHNSKALVHLLTVSFKKLLPVLKAMILLNDRHIPKLRSDIVMAIEDIYNLGASALSEIMHPAGKNGNSGYWNDLFDRYAKTIDNLIDNIDKTI
jgi:hypothetical protein